MLGGANREKEKLRINDLAKNLIFAGFVLLGFAVFFANAQLPFGYKALSVQSGSMEPAISTGSIIISTPDSDFFSPEPISKFLPGDVIVFSGEKHLVTHRVIEIVRQERSFLYKTKGDANQKEDTSLVKEEDVLGKVAFSISYVGRLTSFTKQPIGFLLIVAIPSLYIILSEVWIIIGELRKTRLKAGSKGLVLPLVFVAAMPIFLISGAKAFFSDTEGSQGNTFQTAAAFCDAGPTWLSSVVANNQGTRKDSSPILPGRTDPNVVLGPNDWVSGGGSGFFSLGFVGGGATFSFPYQILNTNASLTFYEATNGRNTYPLESANVFVSQDGTSFVLLGVITSEPGGDGVVTLSLSSVGLSSIQFVRLVDTSNPAIHTNDADALDIDAVAAEFGNCDQ